MAVTRRPCRGPARRLARRPDQQALNFILLHLLALRPLPHHFLFLAHLLHQAGHRFGQLLNRFIAAAAGAIDLHAFQLLANLVQAALQALHVKAQVIGGPGLAPPSPT